MLMLGRASLCFQKIFNSLWHGFHKTISDDLSATHSCCESPILPLPKSVVLDSDPVTGKATEEH